MKKQLLKKIIPISALVLLIIAVAMMGTAAAKSAYLSANHHTSQFDAWTIKPDGTVAKQATYNLNHATDPAGIGIDVMTGLGNDPLMFVSTEGTGGIEVINPVTLKLHGVAPGPVNMGGVDADDANNILFSIQRGTGAYGGIGTSNLYIYTYNDDGTGIAQLANITVPNHGYGMSLAFDDLRDVLWIADVQNSMVRAYKKDNPNWTAIHEEPSLSFSVSHQPVDVTVDRKRNIVYTGGAWLGSNLLTKYEVDTNTETYINTGQGVMGVAVDETTGYVYLTRGTDGDNIQVWDTGTSPFTLIQDTPIIGNPAGIAIANVSYNPLNLAMNDLIQSEGVYIGSTFAYEITCDNLRNLIDPAEDVMITDELPVELDFVSATQGGVYVPPHTVSWDIGTIPAGGTGPLIELVVKVNQNAVPGSTIMNYCTVTYTICGEPGETNVEDDEGGGEGEESGTPILEMIRVYLDIKPGSCLNPVNLISRGLLPVAVLGTEDFDVVTIDPLSIQLSREGSEGVVNPIRSGCEDVATPFEGELCDCHDLNGDGYMDLTLKFVTQELVSCLALEEVAEETIPLILTGNLKEEVGGIPITGEDCVWIK
jgi:Domain of unknown function DUF11